MDMYQQSYNYTYEQSNSNRRSKRMEIAALTLGIIALVSCTCLYLSIPCGALAIIFASLSRGGGMSYGSKAQMGMILGILALVFTITLYAVFFGAALYQYGSIEGILKAYSEMYNMDYNDLIQQLMPSTQIQ